MLLALAFTGYAEPEMWHAEPELPLPRPLDATNNGTVDKKGLENTSYHVVRRIPI